MFSRRKQEENDHESHQRARPLSMVEVYTIAFVAAQRRGFPDAAPDAVGGRVLWLEQRSLPGLIALTRDFLDHAQTPALERRTQCPFIAGTLLASEFDKLVVTDPERPIAITGPTNGLLILPKVAEYAMRIGEPIRVSWLRGEPPSIIGQTVIDADKIAFRGDVTAALINTGVAFARHGAPHPGSPAPLLTVANIPENVLSALVTFIGPQLLDKAEKVQKIFSGDSETLTLLRMMSAGDRSILESAPRLETEGRLLLTTSPGSNNDKLRTQFVDFVWTERYEADDQPAELKGMTSQHALLQAGKEAMPLLLHTLDRFPATRH